MNVPVLCLEGNNHSGRVGYSILKNLKLEELITTSQTQYIDKASYFLENKNSLEKISKGLREKLINSDLCNAENFTNNFEIILKNIINENK
jgi:predicted O-linked N-acetylglucosamine transferase (SPINDLY family)